MTDKPKKPPKVPRINVGHVNELSRFRLEYGGDHAWDTETGKRYPITGLRFTYGREPTNLWLASDRRKLIHLEDVVFDPTRQCADQCLNLFRGFEVKPKSGDCRPIVELALHLLGNDETLFPWFMDWLAYPLQNTGFKMPTAIIVHGDEGSGKNLFFEGIMLRIYGRYGRVVGQHQLEDKFNDWLSCLLFAVCDEVLSQQERRHLKGSLKALVSGEEISINGKFQPLRKEKNHVNLVFLSNELQPNALDASDRRYCVIWTPQKRDQLFYQRVVHCRDHGGLEAFYAELMERDLSDFDPFAPPPTSEAKADLIDLGRTSAERWWNAWSDNQVDVSFRTCSSTQAYRLYRRWCALQGERNPMAHAVFSRTILRICGDLLSTRQVKLQPSGKPCRMWMTTPPPDGETLGHWAEDQVDAFAALMQGYGHDE